jgi:hypothetical protein
VVFWQKVGVSCADVSRSAQALMHCWVAQRELCGSLGMEHGLQELGWVHVGCVWPDEGPADGCRLD